MNNNHLDNDTNSTERRARIQTISQEIERLSIELNDLLQIGRNSSDEESAAPPQPRGPAPPARARIPAAVRPVQAVVVPPALEVGRQVEILNNYQGLRGFQGVIVRLTTHQVTIRLNGQSRVVVRHRNNVRIVN